MRYGCTWRSTRLVDEADGTRFVLDTTDGEYRCAVLVVAVGVAEPWMPTMPGMELVQHYGQVQPAETYAGKRVFIIGKQNSGFELATGLLPWARQLVLASPSADDPVGRHPDPGGGPGTLPAAVRGRHAGWRGDHPRCRHRPRRAIR